MHTFLVCYHMEDLHKRVRISSVHLWKLSLNETRIVRESGKGNAVNNTEARIIRFQYCFKQEVITFMYVCFF